jgi:adenosylcobinamide-GDP ribazoletransferase
MHYDAIADAADGLAGFVDREHRLAIMDEPTVGAFAVLAVLVVVLVRVAAWSSLGFPAYLLGIFVLSRCLMALAMIVFPPAKDGSLTRIFAAQRRSWVLGVLIVEGLLVAAAVAWVAGLLVVVPLVIGIGAGAGVLVVALRRLGGITGDIVGAIGLVAESAMLLGMAVLRIHG